MTAEKRKRMNSVRYVNNPTSRPGSDREKAENDDLNGIYTIV